jgi:hypothetical protein
MQEVLQQWNRSEILIINSAQPPKQEEDFAEISPTKIDEIIK